MEVQSHLCKDCWKIWQKIKKMNICPYCGSNDIDIKKYKLRSTL